MANQKISDLTTNPGIDGSEEMPTAKSGSNFKNTFTALLNWIKTGLTFSALTDAYDLATAPANSIPTRGATAALSPVVLFDTDPVTVDGVVTTSLSAYVYANGAAGVGATLTAGSNGVFPTQDVNVTPGAVDGVKRYLVRTFTGANRYKNGIYLLTTIGTAGTKAVLTRATDSDETTDLVGQIVIPSGGSANARKVFSQATPATITIGTSPIIYNTGGVGNNKTLQQVTDAGNTTDNQIIVDDGAGNNITLDSLQGIILNAGSAQSGISAYSVGVSDNVVSSSVMTPSAVAVADLITGYGASMGLDGNVNASNGFVTNEGNKKITRKSIYVNLTSAQIKGGNSVAIEVIPTPGAGFAINVTSVVARNNFGTVAFDSGTSISIYTTLAGEVLFTAQSFVDNSVSAMIELDKVFAGGLADTSTIREAKSVVALFNQDSVGGDGNIDLWIEYSIIEL